MTFARTATADTEIEGVPIAAGDKVGLLYCSGNRGRDRVPVAGDVRPQPAGTAHVGYGGGGVHYCLGAGIAKTQLRALFGELLTKLPDIEIGQPELLVSNFIRGIKRLPVHRVTARLAGRQPACSHRAMSRTFDDLGYYTLAGPHRIRTS